MRDTLAEPHCANGLADVQEGSASTNKSHSNPVVI